jgi:hypothetical protein
MNMLVDHDCTFVQVSAHPDPDSLIHEFVARDAAGQLTDTSEWFKGAVTCPGRDLPAEIEMARNPRLTVGRHSRDSVYATVSWDRVAVLRRGEYVQDPGPEVDTVVAVQTPFGWRMRSPITRRHGPVPPPPRP